MYIDIKNVEVGTEAFTIDDHLELEDYKLQLAKESYNLTSMINELYLLEDDRMETGIEGLISGTVDIIKKVVKGILDGIAAIFKFIGKMIKGIINFIKSLFGKGSSSSGGSSSSSSTIKSINKDDTKEEVKATVDFEQILKEEKASIENKDLSKEELLIKSIYKYNKGFFLFIIEDNNKVLDIDGFMKYLKSIFRILNNDEFIFKYIDDLEKIIDDLYKYMVTDYSKEDIIDLKKMEDDVNDIYSRYNKIENYLDIASLPVKLKDNILDKSKDIKIDKDHTITIPILEHIKIDENKIGDIKIDKTAKDYDIIMKEINNTVLLDTSGKMILDKLKKIEKINDRLSKKKLKEDDIKNITYKKKDLGLLNMLIKTYETLYKVNMELSLFYNSKTISYIIKEYLELSKA